MLTEGEATSAVAELEAVSDGDSELDGDSEGDSVGVRVELKLAFTLFEAVPDILADGEEVAVDVVEGVSLDEGVSVGETDGLAETLLATLELADILGVILELAVILGVIEGLAVAVAFAASPSEPASISSF